MQVIYLFWMANIMIPFLFIYVESERANISAKKVRRHAFELKAAVNWGHVQFIRAQKDN